MANPHPYLERFWQNSNIIKNNILDSKVIFLFMKKLKIKNYHNLVLGFFGIFSFYEIDDEPRPNSFRRANGQCLTIMETRTTTMIWYIVALQ